MTEPGQTSDLASLAKEIASSQKSDGGWSDSGSKSSDMDSSVLNHVALATYIRRAAHAKQFGGAYDKDDRQRFFPDPETLSSLEAALAKSWKHLTGKVPTEQGDLLGALPQRKVLSKLSGPTAALHEALLGRSLEVRLEPEKMLTAAVSACDAAALGGPLQAQPAKKFAWGKALAAGVALGAAAFLAPHVALVLGLGQLVAGAAAGWMVTSLTESVIHKNLMHVKDLPQPGLVESSKPKSLVSRLYSKSPEWLRKPLRDAWFGHTKIHHFRTFTKDQVTQFKTTEEKAKLDAYLSKEGRDDLKENEYGLTLGKAGFLTFQACASPSFGLALGAAALLGAGPLFALGFAIPAIGGEYVSNEFHRYTHKPAKEALETASFPMKLFLQSELSRFNVRTHFGHHQDPSVNFNLVPGSDWVCGDYKKESVAQEEEMRRLKLLW